MHQKDAMFADWMDWFKGERYGQSDPFRVPDGRRCTTNGVMAVVADHPGASVESEKLTNQGKYIDKHLQSKPKREQEVPRSFMETFGPCSHPDFEECGNCKGVGERLHVCGCDLCEVEMEACGECDGQGKAVYDPDKRPVLLWGVPFNANLIAYMVEHAPAAETYRLRLLDEVLMISTAQWDGLIVKLTVDEGRDMVEVMEAVV